MREDTALTALREQNARQIKMVEMARKERDESERQSVALRDLLRRCDEALEDLRSSGWSNVIGRLDTIRAEIDKVLKEAPHG